MLSSRRRESILLACGLLALLPYFYALHLQDLREATLGFLVAFFTSFIFYAAACALAVRMRDLSPLTATAVLLLSAAMLALAIFTPPTLSDDMYRYVWDGRVQSQGISPYLYSPDSPELRHLRDGEIWPSINRKSAVTIYPPLAQMVFTGLWQLRPDNIRWFQLIVACGALLGGFLLYGLLKQLQLSTARLVIYTWSPLLIYETAHAAHLEGLLLPLLIAAWWARTRQRDGLTGLLLGLATALKLYPALLFPALWRPRGARSPWRYPLGFFGVLLLTYLPFIQANGASVIGFLPSYLRETFNQGPLIELFYSLFRRLDIRVLSGVGALSLLSLALLAIWIISRPAGDATSALRFSAWLIGTYVLLSQNLFSWYLLWLLPLIAIFLPGSNGLNAWTGWWLFSALVALSYTFFLDWKPIPAAIWIQYLPLYAFLLADLIPKLPLTRLWLWKDRSISTP